MKTYNYKTLIQIPILLLLALALTGCASLSYLFEKNPGKISVTLLSAIAKQAANSSFQGKFAKEVQ